jgi:hypothetical protein
MNRVALTFAVALAACSSPPARGLDRTPRGKLPELDFFVGHWRADGTLDSDRHYTLDYRITPTLRGQWYAGTGVAPAMDMEIHDLWGFDPVTGEIVRTLFDSQQTYGSVRSPGWIGDTLVLEGMMNARSGTRHVRETITRIGPDAFDAVWEVKLDGKWVRYAVEKLHRQ